MDLVRDYNVSQLVKLARAVCDLRTLFVMFVCYCIAFTVAFGKRMVTDTVVSCIMSISLKLPK